MTVRLQLCTKYWPVDRPLVDSYLRNWSKSNDHDPRGRSSTRYGYIYERYLQSNSTPPFFFRSSYTRVCGQDLIYALVTINEGLELSILGSTVARLSSFFDGAFPLRSRLMTAVTSRLRGLIRWKFPLGSIRCVLYSIGAYCMRGHRPVSVPIWKIMITAKTSLRSL